MQNDFTGCATSKNFWKHWKKGLTSVSEKTKTESCEKDSAGYPSDHIADDTECLDRFGPHVRVMLGSARFHTQHSVHTQNRNQCQRSMADAYPQVLQRRERNRQAPELQRISTSSILLPVPRVQHIRDIVPYRIPGNRSRLEHLFRQEGNRHADSAVYIFQGAQICRLASRLSLDYEWNFGASFGWKPFHDDEELDGRANIYNTVVGSKVNAYINASLILTYRPVNQATLFFGVDISHFSNGNTRYPNAGVNTLGIKVGGTYGFGECSMRKPGAKLSRKADYGFNDIWSGTRPYCSIPDEKDESRFINRMSLNVTLYGALRSKGLMYEDNAYILGNKFAVAGIDLNPMYRVGKCFAAGLSVDLQYDESANLRSHIAGTDYTEDGIKLLVRRPPLKESLAAGLSLRAELIMPIFTVGVGVGHNIIYNGSDFDGFYQVFNLKASLSKRLFLNIGYKLTDLKRPNNLMIGLGWSFHRIRTK